MDDLLGMTIQDGNAEAILSLESFAQESVENHFEGTAYNKQFLMTQLSNKLLNGINGLLDHTFIINYEVNEVVLNRLFEKLILMARKYNVQLDQGVLTEVINKVEGLYVNAEDDPAARHYGRSAFEMLDVYRKTKPY